MASRLRRSPFSAATYTTYAAEVDLGPNAGPSRVYQVVCSPFRNPLAPFPRRVVKATGSRLAARVFSALARASGVSPSPATWSYLSHRTYDNSIGELNLDEDAATVTIYRAVPPGSLERLYIRELSG